MLERASACLDPAAHQLFRRLETPTRSKRVLANAFWRNRGDDIDVPAWWPVYLSKVRASSFARGNTSHRNGNPDQHQPFVRSLGIQVFESPLLPYPTNTASRNRSFRTTVQRATPDLNADEGENNVGLSEYLAGTGVGISSARNQHQREQKAKHAFPSTALGSQANYRILPQNLMDNQGRLQQILDTNDIGSRNKAWSLYISMENSPTIARRMVSYLSSSISRIDLTRALTAYNSIPTDERNRATYSAAVRTSIKLREHSKAIKIHCEASKRGLASESSALLFSHFVKYQLWRSAALLLSDLQERKSGTGRTEAGRPDSSKSLFSIVDEMVSLPEKLLSLGRRLSRCDPVLHSHQEVLRQLAHSLLFRVVLSPKIMNVITANGFLTLFDTFKELGLSVDHYYLSSLHTLHKLRQVRNRAQLAVLIYRNLRFISPKAEVPTWVFGILISMCSDAGYPAHIFNVLLKEFAKSHGKPDMKAYQRSMTACARQADFRSVEDLFQRLCHDHGVPKNLAHFTPLLYAHASVGNVIRTQYHFSRLYVVYGLVPNTHCWNILLYAHVRSQDSSSAYRLFQNMIEQGVRPDAHTFGTLMGMFANSGDTEAVLHFVDLARRYQIPGQCAMVDTLVQSYCLNDELESAENLAEAATNLRLDGSPTRMWNIILKHYAFQRDSTSVVRIQNKMRDLAVKPDSMTYATLMSALVILGRTKDAMQILRSLHFNHNLVADPFHYSIILHGFVQENDRDMAAVIYHEILERFPRPSTSSRLAMLKIQAKRDQAILQQQQVEGEHQQVNGTSKAYTLQPYSHALEFLSKTLFELNSSDLSSKQPQPGFRRRPSIVALPSAYMEFLIANILATSENESSFQTVEALLSRYKSMIEASYLNKDKNIRMSTELMTLYIVVCTRRRQWEIVDKTWKEILALAIAETRPFSAIDDAQQNKEKSETPPAASLNDKKSSNLRQISYLEEPIKPMIAAEGDAQERPQIIPARRFALTLPFTRYLQALDAQRRTDDIISLVEELQTTGFALSSKNWNLYVQSLAKSPIPSHQLLAFTTFENMLLPNAPSWRILRRGKWVPPSETTEKSNKNPNNSSEIRVNNEISKELRSEQHPFDRAVRRIHTELTKPGVLIPTYVTTVYLASALMKFHRREIGGQEMNMRLVRQEAPGTFSLVTGIPYLRDRVQGILLRGRRVKGDPARRPTRHEEPDRSGLQGSKSPLDHIPLECILEVERSIDSADKSTQEESEASKLERGERYTGQILRSRAILPRTGRYEQDFQKRKRIAQEVSRKIAVAEQIRKDAMKEHMIMGARSGEPPVDALDLREAANLEIFVKSKAVPMPPRALLDPHQAQLEQLFSDNNRKAVAALDLATKAILANSQNIDQLSVSSTAAAADAAVKVSRARIRLHYKREPRLAIQPLRMRIARLPRPRSLALQYPTKAWTRTLRQSRSFRLNKETRKRRVTETNHLARRKVMARNSRTRGGSTMTMKRTQRAVNERRNVGGWEM